MDPKNLPPVKVHKPDSARTIDAVPLSRTGDTPMLVKITVIQGGKPISVELASREARRFCEHLAKVIAKVDSINEAREYEGTVPERLFPGKQGV